MPMHIQGLDLLIFAGLALPVLPPGIAAQELIAAPESAWPNSTRPPTGALS